MNLIISITIYCTLLSLITLATLYFNNRLFLQDYPEALQKLVPQKTTKEKLYSGLIGLFFLFVYIYMPFSYVKALNDNLSVLSCFLTLFIFFLSFNIIDLLFLDFVIFVKWSPKFLILKDTDGHSAYQEMSTHVIGFIKGFILGTILSIILTIFYKI